MPVLRLIVFVILAALIFRRGWKSKAWIAPAIATLSLAVAFVYSARTPLDVRAHDVAGHAQYLQIIRETGEIPRMDQGWETFQPPLYYFVVEELARVGVTPTDFAFAVFGLTTLLFLFLDPNWIGVGLLGLLPAHLFYSGRLNNDVPFALYGAIFLLLYDRVASSGKLGGLVGVSVATKLSGLAFWPAMLPLIGRAFRVRNFRRILILLVPSVVFVGVWFFRSYVQTGNALYTNVAMMPKELLVPNDLNRFIGFDFTTYLTQVSADPWGSLLRLQMWPYFIVTALQGEFPYAESYATLFGVERILALGLILTTAWLLGRPKNRDLLRSGAFALVIGQTAFFVVLSAMNPFGPNHDARYWGLAFPALAWLLSRVASRIESKAFRWVFYGANAALMLCFLGFYVALLG